MEYEIFCSARQSTAIWNALDKIPPEYNQDKIPIELESIAAAILGETIDSDILARIKQTADNNDAPYLLIRNFLLIQDLPPAPHNDIGPAAQKWRVPAAALLGLLRLTGHSAHSLPDEMNGRLCHMVIPARNNEESLTRPAKKRRFHGEGVNGYFIEENRDIAHPVAAEYVGLIGLRNPDTIPVLRERADGTPGIRYSHSKPVANNKKAHEALEQLSQSIKSTERIFYIALNPGDVLLINSRANLHERGATADSENVDGMDRWPLRIYVINLPRCLFSERLRTENILWRFCND